MRKCKYCPRKIEELYLQCHNCKDFVHLSCSRKGTPGGLVGDVFFIYTCSDCTLNNTEHFERSKIWWVDVVLLVLYNLTEKFSHNSMGNGYFHRDKQIKKFLNTNWLIIFPHMKSKRKTWKKMLDDTLKKFPQYFKCNDARRDKQSSLWFKLASPSMLPIQAQIDRNVLQFKDSRETREDLYSETSTGYDSSSQDAAVTENSESSSMAENHLNSMSLDGDNNMYSRSYVKPSPRLSKYLFAGEEEALLQADEEIDIEDVNMELNLNMLYPSDDNTKKNKGALNNSDEDTRSLEEPSVKSEVLNPRLLTTNPKPNDLPWINTTKFISSKCKPMNLGEEGYELSKLKRRIEEAELMSVGELRLHRKLVVRKSRRERGLPVFNIDLYSKEGEVPSATQQGTCAPRVLDRYRRRTVTTDATQVEQSFWTRLMGCDSYKPDQQLTNIISPLTNRTLKPFIRIDYETQPLWLQLCTQIREKSGGMKDSPSPIVYSYVRPHHIHAVNSLAEQFFWPGINMSECLQYPDYSCVVLYKKLLVGFAFMVPDANFNEAYISFIFTRPEWRRAGIATFMLYHLIQTCIGKDITLHVSATNPSLFLYQKFGFKVEAFIQDFYDKYLPVESSECRHALFLRLAR